MHIEPKVFCIRLKSNQESTDLITYLKSYLVGINFGTYNTPEDIYVMFIDKQPYDQKPKVWSLSERQVAFFKNVKQVKSIDKFVNIVEQYGRVKH